MTVLVVGGGITGLAAAHALGGAGISTLLVEASPRLGGKVRTETVNGFVIEHGPDSFVSYRPAGLQLIRELGLGDAIIAPQEPRRVYVRSGGRLRRFPDGMGLVLPTKVRPFVTSDLFSPLQKLRMGLDLVLPRSKASGDVAVGPFLRRRLGAALVDRLASPLIGGVYGTPIDQLSLDAVVPQLRAHEREHRSLLLAALADARARSRTGAATPKTAGTAPRTAPSPFVTLAGGTQQLVDALVAALRAMPAVGIRTGVAVEELVVDGAGTRVRLTGGEQLCPEAVLLATPAPATARLLDRVAPEAAAAIRSIRHGTTAVVNLAYGSDQLPFDPGNHGFLVAGDEPMTISACTVSSTKWAGRAPDGAVLVRAFVGSGRGLDASMTDEALVAAAAADVGRALEIHGAPLFTRVARYPDAMPQYTVGHLDRVAAAEAALAAYPAIRIAGGAFRGVGLPDCIGQGRAAATAIAGLLSTGAQRIPETPAAAAAMLASETTLDAVGVGRRVRVVSIRGGHDAELALEGLLPGTLVDIASRAPLGGPLVLGIGRARVAVARSIAAHVAVDVEPEPGLAADAAG